MGSESRTCQSNGNWQPEIPDCRRKEICPSPHTFTYTHTHTHTHIHIHMSSTNILILSLYDEYFLSVLALACVDLPHLEHGAIQHSNGNKLNSVATYICDSGYQFKKGHGDIKRVCKGGLWSGSPPLCIRKLIAFSLPSPSSTNPNETLHFICNLSQ